MEYILKEKAKAIHFGYSVAKRIGFPSKTVSARTKGVKVVSTNAGSVKLSIWDMGGQDEFHAFHALVIPNLSDTRSASLFILTCSLAKSKGVAKTTKEIDSELRYWLRFLSSNIRSSGNLRLHVIIVFTHVDIFPKSQDTEIYVKVTLDRMKDLFVESCEFSSREYYVTSHSTKMIEPFVEHVVKDVDVGLARAPNINQACVQMEEEVAKWRRGHPFETIIKWKDFVVIYQHRKIRGSKVQHLDPKQVQEICTVVASESNEGGHIIFFEDLDVVVVDPNWFGTRIIGSISSITHECLDPITKQAVTDEKGYTERDGLKSVLENSFNDGKGTAKKRLKKGTRHADIEDVICLMKKMNIRYEGRSGDNDDKRGFIPATLRDEGDLAHQGRRELNWNEIATSSQELIYIGRRLQCEDLIRTFFSPGYSPRLQVALEGKFGSSPTFRLEKNLVAFTGNGMQAMVEHSGNVTSGDYFDSFIDIMVQSTKHSVKPLQFAKDEVVKPIRELCASPTFGFQGITLPESILRPACVEKLWLCTQRRDQAISENMSIDEVFAKQEFEGYVHHWPLNPIQPHDQCGDEVQTLLGDVVWNDEVVNRRIVDMMDLTHDMMQDQNTSRQDVLPNTTEETGHEQLESTVSLQSLCAQLKEEMRKMRDLLIEVVGKKGDQVVNRGNPHMDKKFAEMRAMLCEIKLEISKDVNRVINHSVHSLQRQVPCYVYVTTDDLGAGEWLISSLVPGLKSAQLRLMCEHKGNIHTVVDQKGVALRLKSEALRNARPYVIWGLRIITMLMKVSAHAAAGLGFHGS